METISKTDNELIAEFMGWQKDSQGLWSGCKGGTHYKLTFHSNWNELMPVVEKISKLRHPEYVKGFSFEEWEHSKFAFQDQQECVCNINIGYTNIALVYQAVVEFIKWYNNQN